MRTGKTSVKSYKPVQFKSSAAIISDRPSTGGSSQQRVVATSSASQSLLQRNASWDGGGGTATAASQQDNYSGAPAAIAQQQQQQQFGGSAAATSGLGNSPQSRAFNAATAAGSSSLANSAPGQSNSGYQFAVGSRNISGGGGGSSGAKTLPRSFSSDNSPLHVAARSQHSPGGAAASSAHKSVSFTNQTVVHGGSERADTSQQASSARWTPTLTSSAKLSINQQTSEWPVARDLRLVVERHVHVLIICSSEVCRDLAGAGAGGGGQYLYTEPVFTSVLLS